MKNTPSYGYSFHENGEIKDTKNHVSYSALDLFCRDKQAYRDKYYLGKGSFVNAYTIFGTETHRLVETGDLILQGHPKDDYEHEMKVEANIDGVLVLGYIDLLKKTNNRVIDLKTSVNPWTPVMVRQLKQLPLYQILVREMYGKCSQYASVVWLETAWQEEEGKTIMCGDFELEQTVAPRKLVLTGKQHTFPRRIEQYERDNVREWIVKTAGEISRDFEEWRLANNPF